jgi:hypothetical protein
LPAPHAGCLASSADVVDPGRVNIFERWESQSAVDAFRSSGPDDEQRPAILTVSVEEYDVAGVQACSGKAQHDPAAPDRAMADEIGAAVRSNRATINPTTRELRP